MSSKINKWCEHPACDLKMFMLICCITLAYFLLSPTLRAEKKLPPTMTLDLGKDVKMEFVLIPAGSFTMGSDKSRDNEKPAHKVTITNPFYLGKYEVTQPQYEVIMGMNPSGFKNPKNPVEKVTWYMAVEFCEKLSKKTGKTCRLPTEAEWEYACRAGSDTKYCFGEFSKPLKEYAWFKKNAAGKTHEVGQKKPNDWGLYDMYGNAWEWCQDWYDQTFYANSPEKDPKGPETGKWRVLRGGSWYEPDSALKSSTRARIKPKVTDTNYGFRVCVEK